MKGIRLYLTLSVVLAPLLPSLCAANENISPIGEVTLTEPAVEQTSLEADKVEAESNMASDGPMNAESVSASNTKDPVIENSVASVPEEKQESKPAVSSRTRAMAAANRFNRLLTPPSKRNPPPSKDGIHDPESMGTSVLQHPREAFAAMPKSKSGNRVDWVAALEKGRISPRFDLNDPDKQPMMLDLNIVREVKGSMPDVLYPHKQHTEWLDCSNCHPAIFVPQKGANDISMAAILLGEKCGVCHGKVAFPVSECRKCHSQSKSKP